MNEELDKLFIEEITKTFNKIKQNDRYSIKQKNVKYADLMTQLESHFHIPLLECDINDEIDKEVYELYTYANHVNNTVADKIGKMIEERMKQYDESIETVCYPSDYSRISITYNDYIFTFNYVFYEKKVYLRGYGKTGSYRSDETEKNNRRKSYNYVRKILKDILEESVNKDN